MWAAVLLKTIAVQLAKAFLKAALDPDALKPLAVDLMKGWAKSTKTDVDDTYVANIEKAMAAEDDRIKKAK